MKRADCHAKKQAGESKYIGKPCPNGHAGERWVHNRSCVECSKAKTKLWIANNKERHATTTQSWRSANATKCRAYNWKTYGAPMPERDEPELCECCGKPETHAKNKRLQLDHCHSTGVFRGWLCWACNASIGKLGDDIAGVQKALHYLERVNGTI